MNLDKSIITDIQSIINNAKNKAIRAVDYERVLMYWQIGKRIFEEEQGGQERAIYGEKLISFISERLVPKFGNSFSPRNLNYFRHLYRCFPIVNALRSQLSWTHYRSFSSIDNEEKRTFYIAETVKNNWTARQMDRQIDSQLYKKFFLCCKAKTYPYFLPYCLCLHLHFTDSQVYARPIFFMTQKELTKILNDLRSLPAETEVVEFKEAKNDFHFDKIGKYFSALSNEANLCGRPYAWLVFGIENNSRKIVSSNYRNTNRAALDSLKAEIANKTTNRITLMDIHELALPEGRVLMFQIPAAPQGIPIAWEGHYYGRDGEELSPLNLEEIERIRKQVQHIDWSSGICEGATIDDLDSRAIAMARTTYAVKNPRLTSDLNQWDDITFLNKAKLTIKGKITRTAIILLGKPESEHFIAPAICRITWVLKNKENVERDYEHFSCPLLLTVNEVYLKIRNLKYRYIKDGTLFPDEVDQYDPFNIREALNNCIAHQDYALTGKINVVETEDAHLTFTNLGEFLPGSIESIIESDVPPGYYRNGFLAQAMVNLNMIDTVGSGIKRMFRLQKERFFPMPDYDTTKGQVKATLTGKVLDVEFARVLAKNPTLSLEEIIMLDKVQKHKPLTDTEAKILKNAGLIEGKKPHYYISVKIAQTTGQKASYTRHKAFSTQQYFDWIIKGITDHGSLGRHDINVLLWDKLSDLYDDKQKYVKINNLIATLRQKGIIQNTGTDSKPVWVLIKTTKEQ